MTVSAQKIYRRISDRVWLQLLFAAAITALFGVFIKKTAPSVGVWWPEGAARLYAGLFALAMLLLISQRRFDAVQLLFAAACLCCALYARVALLPYESGDFEVYLSEWVRQFGEMSVKEALNVSVGNYNLPYIYYLIILSRFSVEKLLHIKTFSCFFDVVLAFAAMKLVMLDTEDRRLQLGAFLVVLLSPTVMMNSTLWSQCDSVYAAFCLIAIYAALSGRGRLCAISWTLGFCFKLQAVFVLPAMCAALFMGRVKPRHLLWIPAVYLASLIPALAAGRSLASCMSIYTNQIGQYKGLFINAPTVWCLFGNTRIEAISNMSVYLALGVLMIFTFCAVSFAPRLDNRRLLKLFFLSALLAAYILPRMHDRYFYVAEVLAIVYFMYDRRKWYVPAVLTLSSLTSYMEYFLQYSMTSAADYASQTNGIKMVVLSIMLFVTLAAEARSTFAELWKETPDTITLS